MDKVDIFLGLLILWNLIKDSVGKPFFGSFSWSCLPQGPPAALTNTAAVERKLNAYHAAFQPLPDEEGACPSSSRGRIFVGVAPPARLTAKPCKATGIRSYLRRVLGNYS